MGVYWGTLGILCVVQAVWSLKVLLGLYWDIWDMAMDWGSGDSWGYVLEF